MESTMQTLEVPRIAFKRNRWLGGDTYGYTKKPRIWRHRSSYEPKKGWLSTVRLQAVLDVDSDPVLGSDYLSQLRPYVMRDSYVTAHEFEGLSLTKPNGSQLFRDDEIPASWQRAPNGRPARVLFPDTILTNCDGQKAVLYIRYSFWEEDGSSIWRWGIAYLHDWWYPDSLILTHRRWGE